ncbi:MAG: nicotinate (nicotinamide) nucleotide adenylyltransferase [Gemmatimonadaceae bacterium]
MRLGVFGGSFDPPHVGHFLAAIDAAERLELDRVIWVPAAQQPLKVAAPHVASAEQRFRMVEAAVSASKIFEASRIEIDRRGLSYTVATVQSFAEKWPSAELYLLLGEDAWSHFDEWQEPEKIRTLVQIEILARKTASDFAGRVIEVSSTEVRARARAGRSVRGFVHDAVAEIIDSERLYQW